MSLRKDATKTNVNLSNGVLNDGWVARIAMLMPRNVTMHKVDMSGNGLGLRSAEAISGALTAKHSSLTSLSLCRNPLGAAGVSALADFIRRNVTVEFLDISSVNMTDNGDSMEGVINLASALEEAKGLTTLHMSSNNLTDFTGRTEGAAALAAALQVNQSLRTLDISDNCLGVQGARFLDECVVSNRTLTSLDISMNRIGGNGAQFIASMLSRGSLASLQTLNVSNNDLCGMYGEEDLDAAKQLRDGIAAHEALTALDLSHNAVTIDCGKIIVEGLRKNTSLTQLELAKGNHPTKGTILLCEGRCLANQRLAAICAGAEDVDDYDERRRTALHIASSHGCSAVIDRLLGEFDAATDVVERRNFTPLHCAVEVRDAPAIAALLAAGCDVDSQDKKGDTVLHKAVRSGDGALAVLLVSQGASLSVRNNSGFQAMDVTRSQHLRELIAKHAARRPVWIVCGRESNELEIGRRVRRDLQRRGLECFFGGGSEDIEMPGDSPPMEEDSDEERYAASMGLPSPAEQRRLAAEESLKVAFQGAPKELRLDMLRHCSALIFVVGPYSSRSPICKRELQYAVDHKVFVMGIKTTQIVGKFIDELLYGKPTVNFAPYAEATTHDRAEAVYDELFPKVAEIAQAEEEKFRKQLPSQMLSLIGSDGADMFTMSQVEESASSLSVTEGSTESLPPFFAMRWSSTGYGALSITATSMCASQTLCARQKSARRCAPAWSSFPYCRRSLFTRKFCSSRLRRRIALASPHFPS